MNITIRTLQNKTFQVTIEAYQSVSELKRIISESEDRVPIERQKLIHSGRILIDDRSLSSYEIKEADFIVLMVTKATATLSPVASTTENKESKKSSERQTEGMVSGNDKDFEEALAKVVEMGFSKSEAVRALKAAFMNVDRAVEYLSTGSIPSQSQHESSVQEPSSFPPELESIRNNPQFQELRFAVQQNPDLLYQIIDQIAETNPQLLTLIENNREAFFKLLLGEDAQMYEDEEGNAVGDVCEAEGDENFTMEGEEAISEGVAQQSLMDQLKASPEDSDAIQRITEMGFDRNAAIEAYFACDKNEELAINYLLNNF